MGKSKKQVKATNKASVMPAIQRQPEVEHAKNGRSPQPISPKTMASSPPPNDGIGQAQLMRQMQGTVGNGRISRLMQPRIQPKLTVGAPNDIYEQEADRMADQVMQMPEPNQDDESIKGKTATPTIQRLCPECEEKVQREAADELCPTCQQQLQRQTMKPDNDVIQAKSKSDTTPEVSPNVESYLNRSQGGGQPLPDSVQASMGSRFGQDFSSVRVHTDAEAANASSDLNAQAFTLGQDVYFGNGRYQPGAPHGDKLLAHESITTPKGGGMNDGT